MRKIALTAALVALGLSSCSWPGWGNLLPWCITAPEPRPIVSPIYGQLLCHTLPAGFGPPREEFFADGNFLRQAFWQDETAARWSQRLSVTAAQDLAMDKRATLARYREFFIKNLRRECPESFAVASFKDAPETPVAPGFASEVFVAGCGRSADIQHGAGSESTLFVLIAGEKDYYSLQWAVRGPASDGPPVFAEARWRNRLAALAPIRLCPVIAGEEAPYASCLSEKE